MITRTMFSSLLFSAFSLSLYNSHLLDYPAPYHNQLYSIQSVAHPQHHGTRRSTAHPTRIGANGEPLFTYLINQVPRKRATERMATNPSFAAAGLSPVSEADSPARRERKLSLLNTLSRFQPQTRRSKPDRAGETPVTSPIDQQADENLVDSQADSQYYFGHAWTFWHDKHALSGDYEGRLTLLQDDIMTVKLFWEVVNSFPLQRLGFKDSVHFFKRGVKPVWEDPRNVNGGAWTFRVPKERTDQFWKELLVLAVGEEFFDVVQKGGHRFFLSIRLR